MIKRKKKMYFEAKHELKIIKRKSIIIIKSFTAYKQK